MAKAPAIEQFARNNPGVRVVGVGQQDSFSFAQSFVNTTGVNPAANGWNLVWDGSGGTWGPLGMNAQESLVLVDANGELIRRWASAPGNLNDVLNEL